MWPYMSLIVNEIFNSIDGEGKRAGKLVTFIRLAGCNLRCSYCDTSYALSGRDGVSMSVEEIVQKCKDFETPCVTLTGGEPLIHQNVYNLITNLIDNDFEVNIETNGSVSIRQAVATMSDSSSFITMDIKCPTSNEHTKNDYTNFEVLGPLDVVKFVVGSVNDLDFMLEIMHKYRGNSQCQWYISPVFGSIEPSEIVAYMQKHNLVDARIQLQMHKFIWDPNMRGV